jgi:hypothetical protein
MGKKFWNGLFWGAIVSSLLWIGIIYLICVVSETL